MKSIPASGPPRGSTNSLHSFVSEWLESVKPPRHTRPRSQSESHLDISHPKSSPVLQRSRSIPTMAYSRDADGFVVPPTPASPGSGSLSRSREDGYSTSIANSDRTGSTRTSGRSLVEDPNYRDMNLAASGIFMRSAIRDPLPDHISDLITHIARGRDSQSPHWMIFEEIRPWRRSVLGRGRATWKNTSGITYTLLQVLRTL